MRQLVISDFSCINHATLTFGRLTILIGAQASGKSVLCKLSYFFIDIIREQAEKILDNVDFKDFEKSIKEKFCEWFPISAWGDKKFQIEYTAGGYKITINRKIYRAIPSSDFRIKFSPEFEENYNSLLQKKISLIGKFKENDRERLEFEWQNNHEIRRASEKSIEQLMGRDAISNQIFIPAGRSFFTSIGKAVAAFEQGRVLDPLIVKFGRLFTAYKNPNRYFMGNSERNSKSNISESLAKILGGKYVVKGELEYVQSDDGRKIPLSALSSGQQEILPLVTVLPALIHHPIKQNIYIEEPEAHLFPSAQSKLVEIFAAIINQSSNGPDLVLTTHSPYVLVKINNLMKAGQLGRAHSDAQRQKVNLVVPKAYWLNSKLIKAYAIKDGNLAPIIDSSGYIDADYLDDVSGEISREYMKLLEIGGGND